MIEPDGAKVIPYSGDKVLMHKRDEKAPIFPLYWSLFGGKIEAGETPLSAAVRELGEETGLNFSPETFQIFTRIRVTRGSERPTIYYFKTAFDRLLISDIRLGEGSRPKTGKL